MRKFLFLGAIVAMLVGCETTDAPPYAISEAQAIAIATEKCKGYPERYPIIDRAKWISEGQYWVVDLLDPTETFGKFYMIDARGKLIGVGNIPNEVEVNTERARNSEPVYEGRPYYESRPYYEGRRYYRYY